MKNDLLVVHIQCSTNWFEMSEYFDGIILISLVEKMEWIYSNWLKVLLFLLIFFVVDHFEFCPQLGVNERRNRRSCDILARTVTRNMNENWWAWKSNSLFVWPDIYMYLQKVLIINRSMFLLLHLIGKTSQINVDCSWLSVDVICISIKRCQ